MQSLDISMEAPVPISPGRVVLALGIRMQPGSRLQVSNVTSGAPISLQDPGSLWLAEQHGNGGGQLMLTFTAPGPKQVRLWAGDANVKCPHYVC